jgi:hypothetical protein
MPNYQLIEKNIELAGPHMGGGSSTNVPLQPPFDGGLSGFWCIGGICHDATRILSEGSTRFIVHWCSETATYLVGHRVVLLH